MVTSVRRWAHDLIWGPETREGVEPDPVIRWTIPEGTAFTTATSSAVHFIPDIWEREVPSTLITWATSGGYWSSVEPWDDPDYDVGDTIEGERGGFV